MSRAHTTTSGLRAGKTIAPLSLLAVLLALGCGNSGGNAVGTGGSHSGGATTAAGGVASSAGAGASPAGTTATGGLPATGGVSSNGGVSNTGGVLATGGAATTGGARPQAARPRAAARRRPVALRPDPVARVPPRVALAEPLPVSVAPRRQADPRARAGRAPVAPRPAASLARWWAAARLAAPAVLPLGAAARPAAWADRIRRPVRPAAPPTPIPFAILASPSRIA